MKKILIGCGALLCLCFVLLIGTYVSLPATFEVSRTKLVAGTPAEVFAVAADLHTWPDWTVWSRDGDPSAVWDWTGPPATVGSSMSWKGDVHGTGSLTIESVEENKSMGYVLVFTEEGTDIPSHGVLRFRASGGNTQVDWVMSGDLEGPWRLAGPFMDGLVGGMFDAGLGGLDAHMKTVLAP